MKCACCINISTIGWEEDRRVVVGQRRIYEVLLQEEVNDTVVGDLVRDLEEELQGNCEVEVGDH